MVLYPNPNSVRVDPAKLLTDPEMWYDLARACALRPNPSTVSGRAYAPDVLGALFCLDQARRLGSKSVGPETRTAHDFEELFKNIKLEVQARFETILSLESVGQP